MKPGTLLPPAGAMTEAPTVGLVSSTVTLKLSVPEFEEVSTMVVT